jgi:glycosyltransferase involved in cell wall biosynthesis
MESGAETEAPDVSVLTLAKGRAAHLRRLLDGLARGSRRPAECIVVSMDKVPPSLPAMGFPLTVHHLFAEGLPLAAARNAAARLATSPVLVFLDVDCIPAANLVAALAADAAREDGLICCEILYLPAGATGVATEEQLLARGIRHHVRAFPRAGLRAEPNAGLFWSLAFAVRRPTFERLGGFDEAFSGYGAEDTDFAFRAREAGVRLLFTASTRAFHQHHAIHDPPLNHFGDILANAERFHERHRFWPMEGWLDAFADMGLIEPPRAGPHLRVIRAPSAAEIAASACPPERAY